MDPLTAIAASGLRARMESLELLANNVANDSTSGYKADREFYTLYAAREADSSATMPEIKRSWVDFSQGLLRSTGTPLDLALSGRGFFSVSGPSGTLFTRNGNFRLAPDGRLVTTEGYAVRQSGGNALQLNSTRPIDVSPDGSVHQDGAVVGQLEIVDFPGGVELVKQGSTYLRLTDPAIRPQSPPAVNVEQGKLEASNTGSAESAVRLVSVMRQFEMLQKAVALGAEMNRRAVEEVARVGS